MQLSGVTSKILNPIEKNATLIGSGLHLMGSWTPLADSISNALGGNIHAPDITALLNNARADTNLHMAILGYIAGLLAQESGVGMISRIGKILSQASVGYAATNLIQNAFYFSTHSKPGVWLSKSTQENIAQAPMAQSYY